MKALLRTGFSRERGPSRGGFVGTDSHTKPGLEVSLPIHGAGLAAGENNPAFLQAAVRRGVPFHTGKPLLHKRACLLMEKSKHKKRPF